MKTIKEQEEKELKIKIVFDNNTSITTNITTKILNDIIRVIGKKEGRFVYKCFSSDNDFLCAFIPNKITYFSNMSTVE